MKDPEKRLLVNLENSCNVKSAEAIVALSTLPTALEEAAIWPAHYQRYYSRKPIITAPMVWGVRGWAAGLWESQQNILCHRDRVDVWSAPKVVLQSLSDVHLAWMAYLDGISTRQRCLVSSFPFFSNNGA